MELTKRRWRLLFIGYTAVILCMMFLAFGRTERADAWRYSFEILPIPLWIPKHWGLESLELWVFSLGNVLAFAPFGALLPHGFPRALGTYPQVACSLCCRNDLSRVAADDNAARQF